MRNFYRSVQKAAQRDRNRSALRALYGNADDVAAVVRVIDGAPSWAEEVVLELAKAGISVADMEYAVMGVHRILGRNPRVDPVAAAAFVATTHAITGANGTQMLMFDQLFAVAQDCQP